MKPVLKIMQETVAMSLLYECINGIIQAGILARIEDPQESDEIANLCVEKLAGLILMEEDGNRKYHCSPVPQRSTDSP